MSDSQYFSASPQSPRRHGSVTLHVRGLELELATDRGVFAAAEVDYGTRYLLTKMPKPPAQGTLLDLGCGYGPIATALNHWAPASQIWAVDVNPRALELCRDNLDRNGCANAVVCQPDEVPTNMRFEAIYSNPPIHIGKTALHEMLRFWLARLNPAARAYLVVNKNLGSDSLARWLTQQGWITTRLGSRRGYRILEAQAN
ncbi:MAG: methyltransferase [Acidimicrobiia bacterium]|nr:methyltransferase [Acidimicrobiia bacterium]MYC57360.1 methyltransferase [Acidimicrobiia bacterium]MYI31154.1 methyltransferase [Acidimicrobiia bacterium]